MGRKTVLHKGSDDTDLGRLRFIFLFFAYHGFVTPDTNGRHSKVSLKRRSEGRSPPTVMKVYVSKAIGPSEETDGLYLIGPGLRRGL